MNVLGIIQVIAVIAVSVLISALITMKLFNTHNKHYEHEKAEIDGLIATHVQSANEIRTAAEEMRQATADFVKTAEIQIDTKGEQL